MLLFALSFASGEDREELPLSFRCWNFCSFLHWFWENCVGPGKSSATSSLLL